MPDQILIGAFPFGQKTDRTAFNIDNNAFPNLFNFYSWRGRAKRKRGTLFLGQLEIQVQSVATATPPANWQVGTIATLNGSGNASFNLITLFSLPSTSTITPGSIDFSDGTNTFTEPATPDGTLVGTPSGSGTINYATGAVTITGGAPGGTLVGFFSYFPSLPVMGLRQFVSSLATAQYPLLLAFDTEHSYQINQSLTNVFFYNTTYYKGTNTPFEWNGQDYQQFWTVNYLGALWATNGNSGFHFVNGTYISGSGSATITFNFKTNGVNYTQLIIGDKLWFNEWSGGSTINGLVGTVSNNAGAAIGDYVVSFTGNQTVSGTGIAQLLTASISGQDGIRWYDGDPTNGTGLPTVTGLGWVNFAPPLTAATVSIDNSVAKLYYLTGAKLILNFKDRLMFFYPTIQATDGTTYALQDVILWSWNGTPYYTTPVPTGQTADITAYYVDVTGKGGWLAAGIDQPISTVAPNEDVLIVGFAGNTGSQTRFAYTGNDLFPFAFFSVNTEFPSNCTFSSIILDRGVLSVGAYGIIIASQNSASRIDLDIPDNVFEIQALNNGVQRVNAERDFKNEWVYFSYPTNSSPWKFPTQTFMYNYRDNTWSILYENFTAHGTYRKQSHYTWATLPFRTWSQWREPWNAGSTSAFYPDVVAGNPQGYVLIIGQGTGEGISGTINALVGNGGYVQVTSNNHCVTPGDYLLIQGCLGTTAINMQIGQVISIIDPNNFIIDLPSTLLNAPYLGLGHYVRLSQPTMQSKQFPVYWQEGRQVWLKNQKYLMDSTSNGQVTVNIYLSMDPNNAWNDPQLNENNLPYSQILYTCPESTNIGLTHANTNLQMPIAVNQNQIWHRINTSLTGDTIQLGITLSDAQMRNLDFATNEITVHAIQFTVDRGPLLS